MKIILQQNVRKIGQKGDIVEVNDGYAHNFLFPQGLAKLASQTVVSQKKASQERDEAIKNKKNNELIELLKELSQVGIIVKKPANEKGILFSAVHVDDVISAIDSQKKVKIPVSVLTQDINCKEVGIIEIPYVVDTYKGTLKVDVQAQ